MAMSLYRFWMMVVFFLALAGWEAGAMTLVSNGTATAVVVYQDTADKTSAAVLTNWIAKMTGVKLTLTNNPAVSGPAIYVGKAALAAGLDLSDIQSPSQEGLRIQCDGARLLLAGQDANSTTKAVCRLLEEFGCRYLFEHPLGEVYPVTNTVSAGVLNITEKPGLLYRTIWGSSWSGSSTWKIWTGNGGVVLSMGHAWGTYINQTNFTLHPEWFALRGGVRVKGDWYCTSNPELREAFAQAVIAAIAKGSKHPSLSPPDGRGYCECAPCVAQDDPTSTEPTSGTHNITSDVEVISIQKVNEAYERLLRSDVKYRFSIDMASLKSG